MEYYFGTKSIVQTQRRYQCHFAVRKTLDRKLIELFTILTNRDLDGPEEPELQIILVDAVWLYAESPKKAFRRSCQELGLCQINTVIC